MNKTAAAIVVAGALIAGALFMGASGSNNTNTNSAQQNVFVEGDQQIIVVQARGGYSPRSMNAKANMPTQLRMQTNNTYDCSAAFVIPALGYRNFLPASGMTPITIPPQAPGTVLQAMCGMGMYRFSIAFN